MKNKSIISLFLVIAMAVLLMALTSAQQTNVCCEKTNYGAWCQNARQESCDSSFRITPTSCDATSYCRQGCCYDSKEGICMENTPQLVCQESNGTWADSAKCEIPQCNLGCCIFSDQAAFVTLVRCKKLSSFFGVQINFRADVQTETACIALAHAQDKGACVYEEDFTKTCKFTTKGECDAMKGKKTGNYTSGNSSFHKDYLCTAEELGTDCARRNSKGEVRTGCIDGRDEIYFFDTCGNPANIYDAAKIDEPAYWRKIIDKKDSCGSGNTNSNANSVSCGNCDYFGGSFCRKYDSSKDARRPTYGDFICRDLNCKNTKDGKDYRHGESWCIYDDGTGKGKDPAGSRYWKHICVAGEELVEPCADFRNEICLQDKITTEKGDFQQAGCVANRWQNCVTFKTKEDCENVDKGDCQWIEDAIGTSILGGVQQATASSSGSFPAPAQTTSAGITGKSIFGGDEEESENKEKEQKTLKGSVCVPDYPPGLKFWTAGEAQSQCSLGNAACTIEYEKKGFIGGSKDCVENCECEGDEWKTKNEEICRALGDCTGSEGVYKYLQSGGFGVSGTKLLLPLLKAGDWLTGLSLGQAQIENKSINKGLLENLRN